MLFVISTNMKMFELRYNLSILHISVGIGYELSQEPMISLRESIGSWLSKLYSLEFAKLFNFPGLIYDTDMKTVEPR